MDLNPEAGMDEAFGISIPRSASPPPIKSVPPSPKRPLQQSATTQLAFTLDTSAECTGIHPDEQVQGVVVMPNEHFHTPVETEYPSDLEAVRSTDEYFEFVPHTFTRKAGRPPSEYPPERCVLSVKALSNPDTSHILMVHLEDLANTLNERTIASLGPLLSSFRSLETVILRKCGITSLERFSLPGVIHCDFTLNAITELDSVCSFARNTLGLTYLDLTANPLLGRPQWKEEGWKLVAILTHLDSLNGAALTMEQHILANRKHGNVDDQRRLALRIYDEAFMKCAAASAVATETAFSTIRWNPASIVHLDLSKQQLQVFHVGPLVNLQTLNLSHNFLTRITMGGLSSCTALTSLDVTKNLLADRSNVRFLSHLPSLTALKLAGNPVADERHIKHEILQVTSRCRGVPTCPGLQMLDRKPITLAERVQAFLRYAVAGGPRARDITAGLFRWKLVLMSQFGQAAVNTLFGNTPVAATDASAASSKDELSVDSRLSLSHRSLVGNKEDGFGGWTASMVLRAPQNLAGPLSRLRSLVVQGMALSVVDVRGMIALEIIDLRNNNLEGPGIIGLNQLRSLRVLDLAGNAMLSVEHVLLALKGGDPDFEVPALRKPWSDSDVNRPLPMHTLESVTLGIRSSKNQGSDDLLASSGLFFNIVQALVPLNRNLRVVEGIVLHPKAIADAYKQALGWRDTTALMYTVKLALLMAARPGVAFLAKASSGSAFASSTSMSIRSHHPDDVTPGIQYEPAEVTTPLNLSNIGVRQMELGDLSRFARITVLNLSQNRLTTLAGFGLEAMASLVQLDVHDNLLQMSTAELGAFLSSFGLLEKVAVRGNPCMDPFASKRMELLSHVPGLRSPECRLNIVDTSITLEERIAAWEMAGGQASDLEGFRAECALTVRSPSKGDPAKVTTLDLENANLRHVDLSQYVNLKHLTLRGNLIPASVFGPTGDALGLRGLFMLETIDLRENCLELSNPSNLQAVLAVLSELPQLRSIGLCGNWNSQDRELVEQQRMESSGSTALGISSPVRVAASPSRTIPCSLSREGRLTVLRHLKTIESPYCRLRLLDNIEVSCGEIIDALYDSVGLSEEREDFRAQLAVIRALDGKEADNCVTLDLSSMQLTRLNRHTMLHLVRLQSLDLSNNDLDDIAILKSGIEMLPLVQINLQNNKIRHISAVGAFLHKLRSLKTIWVTGNPCFMENTPHNRLQLLQFTERSQWRGFQLNLNGEAVTAQDQVDGMQLALIARRLPDALSIDPSASTKEEHEFLYHMYLALVLDNMGVSGFEAKLCISGKGLKYFGDLAWSEQGFRNLISLDVSHNEIVTIAGQGLPFMRNLAELNLSFNHLKSLEDTLIELEQCPALEVLCLQNAVDGGSTNVPEMFAARVFSRLRGLKQCDGILCDQPLSEEQLIALNYLRPIVGIYANSLNYVDLSKLNIGHAAYFKIMGPLARLPIRCLNFDDNPCSANIDGCGNSHRLLTIALHRKLRVLDGIEINEEERTRAAEFVTSLPEEAQEQIRSLSAWTPPAQDDDSVLEVQATFNRNFAMLYETARKSRLGPIAFLAYMDDTVAAQGQLCPAPRMQVLDFAEEKEDAAVAMPQSASPPTAPLQRQVATVSARNAAASPSAVSSTARSAAVSQSSEHSMASPQRVSSQSSQRVSVDSAHQARSPVVSARSSTIIQVEPAYIEALRAEYPAPTGTLLQKLEIIIQFFQVYCIILWLSSNNNLQWPQTWKDIKSGYDWPPYLLTVDVQSTYALQGLHVSSLYQEYTRIFLTLASPVLALALYMLLSTLTLQQWVKSCVTSWSLHFGIAHGVLLVLLIGSFLAGVLCDLPRSWDEIKSGSSPKAQMAWIVSFVGTGITYFTWLTLTLLFRRMYNRAGDRRIGETSKLELAWGSFRRNIQRSFLFIMVICYFPAAAAILAAFSDRYDSSVLAAYGCANVDKQGQLCCMRAIPTEVCLASPSFDSIDAFQHVAAALGIIVVLGLPWAMYTQIQDAHRKVSATFLPACTEQTRAKRALELELQTIKSNSAVSNAQRSGAISTLAGRISTVTQALRRLYAEHLSHAAPSQLYMVQGYTHWWRFHKLYLLCEKLMLVCIAFYFPARWSDFIGYTVATAIIVSGLVASAVSRPYVDTIEFMMDISSRLTNSVNIIMCLALCLDTNPSDIATVLILAIANGLNAVVLFTCLILGSVMDFDARAASSAKIEALSVSSPSAMSSHSQTVAVKSPTPQPKPLTVTVALPRLADATVDAGVIRSGQVPLSPTGAADVQRQLRESSISSSHARAVLPGSLEPTNADSDARSVTATAV